MPGRFPIQEFLGCRLNLINKPLPSRLSELESRIPKGTHSSSAQALIHASNRADAALRGAVAMAPLPSGNRSAALLNQSLTLRLRRRPRIVRAAAEEARSAMDDLES